MKEGLTRREMRLEPGRNNLSSFIFYFEKTLNNKKEADKK